MQLIIEVPYSASVPNGYGVAYQNYDRATVMAAPFPINHVIGWARNFWYCILHFRSDWIIDAYAKGRNDGYQEGYRAGQRLGGLELLNLTRRSMRPGAPQEDIEECRRFIDSLEGRS